MRKIYLIFGLLVMSVYSTSLFAQKAERHLFSNLALSAGVSTTGTRIDLATPINDRFSLRGGFSFLSFDADVDIKPSSTTEYRKYIKYMPEIAVNGKISTAHTHILVDFTPAKQGIFHITAGLFFGSTEFVANGLLVNPQTRKSVMKDLRDAGYTDTNMPEFTLEEKYVMRPNNDGGIDAKINLGNTVKPYFGIGFGRSVPKRRVGIKFDWGILYQGKPHISSPNLIKGNLNDYIKDSADLKDYERYFSFWPVLNIQLTVRLF